MNKKKYSHIALGGTFDRIHQGHRFFLKNAFNLSAKVTIGITSDRLAKRIHKKDALQLYKVRKKALESFLIKEKYLRRSKIIKLEDIYGITVEDSTFDALLVTKSTIAGGKKINAKRLAKGKKELIIKTIPLQKSEDGKVISSNRIRDGQINREGLHFSTRLLKAVPINIPDKMREEFRKPFGKVFKANDKQIYTEMKKVNKFINRKKLKPIICVGDVVTHSLLKVGGSPKLKIVDLRVQRKKRYANLEQIGPIGHLQKYSVSNKAGTISKKLCKQIYESIKKKTPSVIEVKGEEDLAVLPCVLLAPLGAVVLYGHFQYGIIAVTVTEAKKSAAIKLLCKMKE